MCDDVMFRMPKECKAFYMKVKVWQLKAEALKLLAICLSYSVDFQHLNHSSKKKSVNIFERDLQE